MTINLRVRKIKEKIFFTLSYISIAITLIILGSVIFFTFVKGINSWSISFFLSPQRSPLDPNQGIAHAIQGSLLMSFLAAAISTPISILAAIYLSEYASTAFREKAEYILDAMAGIPSIVVGVVSYLLFVLPLGTFSAFAGSMALAIMMFPLMTRASQDAFMRVGREYREAGLAVGLPKWKVSLHIVLYIDKNGVITGFALAFGRIFGETAPLLMTALGSRSFPTDIFAPTSSITLLIYEYSKSPFEIWINIAWGASLFILIMNLAINLVIKFSVGDRRWVI